MPHSELRICMTSSKNRWLCRRRSDAMCGGWMCQALKFRPSCSAHFSLYFGSGSNCLCELKEDGWLGHLLISATISFPLLFFSFGMSS